MSEGGKITSRASVLWQKSIQKLSLIRSDALTTIKGCTCSFILENHDYMVNLVRYHQNRSIDTEFNLLIKSIRENK